MYNINKRSLLIKNNFSKAASTYLKNALIQIPPALKIIDTLNQYTNNGLNLNDNEIILDLGSGPGTLKHNKTIKNKTTHSTLSFDISLEILAHNNNNCSVNGDANYLPFANNSFPFIISNLMLQWSDKKSLVISEMHRVLKTTGKLILTTLIKPSLHELQQAWAEVDGARHTLHFLDQDKYLSAFNQAGFSITEHYNWHNTEYFFSLSDLMWHFKHTGTNLTKQYHNNGLGGKLKLQKLSNAYQKLAIPNKGLPLTYTYLFIVATKEN
ncbi:MAG: malonyl-CoA O-methyltransferase [Pseudomonadota bacterium]|nr:malonyl-CoA O-methyltransferase [Pseudomonadota bacterium]